MFYYLLNEPQHQLSQHRDHVLRPNWLGAGDRIPSPRLEDARVRHHPPHPTPTGTGFLTTPSACASRGRSNGNRIPATPDWTTTETDSPIWSGGLSQWRIVSGHLAENACVSQLVPPLIGLGPRASAPQRFMIREEQKSRAIHKLKCRFLPEARSFRGWTPSQVPGGLRVGARAPWWLGPAADFRCPSATAGQAANFSTESVASSAWACYDGGA